ncbi:MAG TPA: bifunctional glutathionylspermidine amidase/synthase [Pseudomonadales bacterium]
MQPNHPSDGPAPFGTLLGVAPGEVPAYSSDYDTADERLLPNRSAYRSYLDGIYMGYKWQCVEFARRWMYLNRGLIFDDVAMAYEIFQLRSIRDVRNDRELPLRSFRNGSKRHPEPGCLVIWSEGGEFERTGHVAVVTEVYLDRVRLAEQNVGHRVWPQDRNFAREIPARITDDGGFWLRCSFGDASILGWVVQTDDDTHAEKDLVVDPRLFEVRMDRVANTGQGDTSWLNVANPDEAAYVAMMGNHRLASRDENQTKYYVISETAHNELRRATNELHAVFLHATEYVLRDDALLERFNIPRVIWPRIHQSWNNRRNQMVTGRFDFAMTVQGLKVYEYNCDSASCHMDAGKIQGKWAEHFGCDVGRDPGATLLADLAEAWKDSEVDDVLHILIDRDPEEVYHALFMKQALDAAGIESRILEGVDGLDWNDAGEVVDPFGTPIRWVWKTWAWETALDQIREECEEDEEKLANYRPGEKRDEPPRLVDVLLRPEVMVFEPLWTLIPSNKAILPIIWQLFANQRYLLKASYELTEEIRANGYVQKPIVGRCGANISLFDSGDQVLEETAGRFDSPYQVFQELFPLPVIDGDFVQLCTFSAGGTYGGTCVRVDPSMVITADSDIVALRVVNDKEFLEDFASPEEGYQI